MKKIKRQIDLNEIAFQKLRALKPNKSNIIPFKKIWSRICAHFSIKKELCWKLLMDFKQEGKIEIICCHGVRISE